MDLVVICGCVSPEEVGGETAGVVVSCLSCRDVPSFSTIYFLKIYTVYFTGEYVNKLCPRGARNSCGGLAGCRNS